LKDAMCIKSFTKRCGTGLLEMIKTINKEELYGYK